MSEQPKTTSEKRADDPRSKGWIKPGEVRNPNGRPKGSRHALGKDFLETMQRDFAAHGPEVVARVRHEKPAEYLKVIAAILPKELHVKTDALNELSDDELVAALESVRSLVTAGALAALGSRDEETARH